MVVTLLERQRSYVEEELTLRNIWRTYRCHLAAMIVVGVMALAIGTIDVRLLKSSGIVLFLVFIGGVIQTTLMCLQGSHRSSQWD